MMTHLHPKHAAKIALMTELTKDRHCGTTTCVLEIDRVGKVGNDAEGIDNDKHPLSNHLPKMCLFQMKGYQHQHRIEGIGIEDGRSVKHPAALECLPKREGVKPR